MAAIMNIETHVTTILLTHPVSYLKCGRPYISCQFECSAGSSARDTLHLPLYQPALLASKDPSLKIQRLCLTGVTSDFALNLLPN